MDSDESGHSESEFYFSEEETFNQMTPINRDEEDIQKKKNKYVIYRARSVPTQGLRHSFFSHTDIPPGK